jgi:hypothetical protein
MTSSSDLSCQSDKLIWERTFAVHQREFDGLVVYSTLYLVHFLLDNSITNEKPNRKHKNRTSYMYCHNWPSLLEALLFSLRGPIFHRAGMHIHGVVLQLKNVHSQFKKNAHDLQLTGDLPANIKLTNK